MNIIGASGHAKVVIDTLEELNQSICGIWDEDVSKKSILNYSISGQISEFKDYHGTDCFIAIGNNLIRKKLFQDFLEAHFPKLIHPKAIISKYATVDFGTIVAAGATVNACASIGAHVIINTNSSVDHDCYIDNFVHISPNVALAGNVIVSEGAHVGIGATVIQGIKIGKWSTIGAGSVVINDVPDYGVVVGIPAKLIKYNITF